MLENFILISCYLLQCDILCSHIICTCNIFKHNVLCTTLLCGFTEIVHNVAPLWTHGLLVTGEQNVKVLFTVKFTLVFPSVLASCKGYFSCNLVRPIASTHCKGTAKCTCNYSLLCQIFVALLVCPKAAQ